MPTGAPRRHTHAGSSITASGDAELVALWVPHDEVSQGVAVPLLADHRRAGGHQLGHLLPDQSCALGHVPGTRPATRTSMCIQFLADLPSGTFMKPMAGPPAIRVDDLRVVGLIEAGLLDISQGKRPEGSESLGIVGIASQGPMGRHGGNVREPGRDVIGTIGGESVRHGAT